MGSLENGSSPWFPGWACLGVTISEEYDVSVVMDSRRLDKGWMALPLKEKTPPPPEIEFVFAIFPFRSDEVR